MATKIVLCLALASLAAIQVSALPDPAIQLAVTQATAAVATSSAAALAAITNALAIITNASTTVAASSSIAVGYKTLLPTKMTSILNDIDDVINYGIPLWGLSARLLLACVDEQRVAIAAVLDQAANGVQVCVNNVVNQVTVHNGDIQAQQRAAASLVASAAARFTNCTTYTGTTTDVLTCISIVVSTITNRADIIAHNVQAYAAGVGSVLPNSHATLVLCGSAIWYQVFLQLSTISNTFGLCSAQSLLT